MKRTGFTPAVLLLTAFALSIACSNRGTQLPNYGSIPEFTMVDSEGHPFDSKSLLGKVWVVDFIYTHCRGPCPLMTSKMHRLQRRIQSEPDVRLVSISVDPERDTPAVLEAYAHHFGGPASDWTFLTGTRTTIHLIAREVFKEGDVGSGNNIEHSTRFMLVDEKGNLRGYYSVFDSDGWQKLLGDIDALRKSD